MNPISDKPRLKPMRDSSNDACHYFKLPLMI